MREIKFRVWNHQTQSWINDPHGSMLFRYLKGAIGTYIGSEDRCVPQQYTGLKDKNGKEIYEGDIVKFTRLFEKERKIKELISFVKYEDAKFGFDLKGFNNMFYHLNDENDIEVIGNIFENHELLTQ